jgi:hypothetical protein
MRNGNGIAYLAFHVRADRPVQWSPATCSRHAVGACNATTSNRASVFSERIRLDVSTFITSRYRMCRKNFISCTEVLQGSLHVFKTREKIAIVFMKKHGESFGRNASRCHVFLAIRCRRQPSPQVEEILMCHLRHQFSLEGKL